MTQAQRLDTCDDPDLQNNKLLAAKRVKRVSDLTRSQMLVGYECSSLGVSRSPMTSSG